MSHALRNVIVSNGTPALYGPEGDFRTRVMSYLADPVLPVVTLLCISVLTVAIIVVMVTAVATAFVQSQSDIGTIIDPWANVSSSSGRPYEDQPDYPGDAWTETRAYNRVESSPVARWTP